MVNNVKVNIDKVNKFVIIEMEYETFTITYDMFKELYMQISAKINEVN